MKLFGLILTFFLIFIRVFVSTGGFIQAAHIPSSRIPNIYDPEGPIPNPNPEESCFPLVKNSTIVRVIPSSEQKKSADAALSFIFSGMSIEKIHRAAPLGSRREDGQLFGLVIAAPGLVFLPARPGGVPAAAPVPSSPNPNNCSQ